MLYLSIAFICHPYLFVTFMDYQFITAGINWSALNYRQ